MWRTDGGRSTRPLALSRPIAAAPVSLALSWTDIHNATGLTAPAAGPLPLPTSRDVRVELRALCREDAALQYFGADDVRRGALVSVLMRKEAIDETGLLLPAEPAKAMRGIFLQPSPPTDPTLAFATQAAGQAGQPGDETQRLATSINLVAHEATLRGRPGRRTVFGARPECGTSLDRMLVALPLPAGPTLPASGSSASRSRLTAIGAGTAWMPRGSP